ncbi:MAG: 2-phospho-L-lactate guanylyltransferase [Rhizomicrobium sp.]
MTLRIVIPVKPFAEAKQRLSPVMAPEARAKLVADMFKHVFATARLVVEAQAVIVLSRDRDVLALAEAGRATALIETTRPDLNAALSQAAQFGRANGASKLLILVSDLPLLCKSDLVAMIEQTCVVAPDRHGRGTNALLWPASASPGFHFGENSFALHCAAARTAGFDPQIVSRRGLGSDVDLPEDLQFLSEALSQQR